MDLLPDPRLCLDGAAEKQRRAEQLPAVAGVIDQPLEILHTNLAVYIGIVYAYLPFMVLPIYTALTRIDYSLVEASLDLGARPLKTFFQVIVPLTKGGIIAGSMLVFIPAVGEFVIPELLGGPDSIMIGRVLWQEFSITATGRWRRRWRS